MTGRREHGLTGTATHNIWLAMLSRCSNPNDTAWGRYGGRGITVCERWKKFTNFLSDMGERPPGLTLDRINNNGPYAPENCRWATWKEQYRNRRTNRFIEFGGKHLTLTDWAAERGLKSHTLLARLRRGWDVSDALNTPCATR